jgi:hypothetical protein
MRDLADLSEIKVLPGGQPEVIRAMIIKQVEDLYAERYGKRSVFVHLDTRWIAPRMWTYVLKYPDNQFVFYTNLDGEIYLDGWLYGQEVQQLAKPFKKKGLHQGYEVPFEVMHSMRAFAPR